MSNLDVVNVILAKPSKANPAKTLQQAIEDQTVVAEDIIDLTESDFPTVFPKQKTGESVKLFIAVVGPFLTPQLLYQIVDGLIAKDVNDAEENTLFRRFPLTKEFILFELGCYTSPNALPAVFLSHFKRHVLAYAKSDQSLQELVNFSFKFKQVGEQANDYVSMIKNFNLDKFDEGILSGHSLLPVINAEKYDVEFAKHLDITASKFGRQSKDEKMVNIDQVLKLFPQLVPQKLPKPVKQLSFFRQHVGKILGMGFGLGLALAGAVVAVSLLFWPIALAGSVIVGTAVIASSAGLLGFSLGAGVGAGIGRAQDKKLKGYQLFVEAMEKDSVRRSPSPRSVEKKSELVGGFLETPLFRKRKMPPTSDNNVINHPNIH